MEPLPDDVSASLARSLGAYIRATPAQELPPPLRRFRGFTPKGVGRHRSTLLDALDDQALRARVAEWLDDDRDSLRKDDKELLRLACARPEGWLQRLKDESQLDGRTAKANASVERDDDRLVERERARARKAKEDARRVKEQLTEELRQERTRSEELMKELNALRHRLALAEQGTTSASAALDGARAQLEREQRKARRRLEAATAANEQLKSALKEVKKESSALSRRVSQLERELDDVRARPKSARAPRPRAARARAPLDVPKGLVDDAPETLDRWLSTPDVHLVVDGYNVSKTQGGYAGLDLEGQRERLVDEISRLARRKSITATVVFDGSDIPPGMSRRRRGGARVEYSKPPETADDHLIALVAGLPPVPVIVATSDRDLQERARTLGATIATSPQLLSLIRS